MKAFTLYLTQNNKLDLEALSKADIEHYLLSAIHGCTNYKQSICFTLKNFFDFIKLAENPARDITFKPQQRKKLFNVPSESVVQNIFNDLKGKEDKSSLRNRVIIELAYGSGLRRTELTRLNVEDIDLNDKSVRVNGKGCIVRMVPLTQSAIETIRIYLEQKKTCRGPLLLSCKGIRLAPNNLYDICIKHFGIRPHLLRHACASHMLKNGCSIRVIQELLGHKSLKSTQIYTEVLKEDLRIIVNTFHPRTSKLNLSFS